MRRSTPKPELVRPSRERSQPPWWPFWDGSVAGGGPRPLIRGGSRPRRPRLARAAQRARRLRWRSGLRAGPGPGVPGGSLSSPRSARHPDRRPGPDPDAVLRGRMAITPELIRCLEHTLGRGRPDHRGLVPESGGGTPALGGAWWPPCGAISAFSACGRALKAGGRPRPGCCPLTASAEGAFYAVRDGIDDGQHDRNLHGLRGQLLNLEKGWTRRRPLSASVTTR